MDMLWRYIKNQRKMNEHWTNVIDSLYPYSTQGIHDLSWFRVFSIIFHCLICCTSCPRMARQTTDFTGAALGCAWLRFAARQALSLWRTKVHAAGRRPHGHSDATKGQTIHQKAFTRSEHLWTSQAPEIHQITLLGNHNDWHTVQWMSQGSHETILL